MVEIHLKNSKSRKVELLQPIEPGRVSLYLCGPTVYDRAHLGNARSAVVFDQLFRLLRHVYGAENVTFVRNFTDVDDKINARALAEGREIADLTAETSQWYLDDTRALGVLDPNHMPRATEYIAEMVAFIEDLIAKGFAYARDGHALFRVRSFDDYGKLSGRSVDDMIAGARVEVAPYKEDPMDFVLWKPSSDDIPGWDSPWGRGRPGWHIECSAMAHALLGEQFDIHGGGADLMFPHHENEVAQSCAAGHGFANIWMHNEMLQVEGKKMSKSLGNFFTVRDLLDQGVPGEVIRFVMLSTHYGKPMDWTEKKRAEAEATLRKWYAALRQSVAEQEATPHLVDSLADDLNTALAITTLHGMYETGNFGPLAGGLRLLGLWSGTVPDWSEIAEVDLTYFAGRFSSARAEAMVTKDFTDVDALKSALTAAGVEVRMSKDGVELVPGPTFDPAKLEDL
ncbi:cysteine--tRNA ligase [Jannaschia sp. CCS1]|uniref:Cysteine--tRNA ligase n=1 Tax=Jannaschia sp. (strain CCS1) TaxID=290400 RepID=SYC_JANSC|nr:cysteine--tRNA ligase [Jannaschia sp. CCS1]Q28QY7.1 RecName: Full=Cysteine--tRNA ligase; AltName: Full=Cysteinyl-tRNA synthetase; Short=CysRS [Jannaschia sp. CCS1]ABD54875.1 cysteinyl-tRNA synthetase [Jannaschia sp. CCS1]